MTLLRALFLVSDKSQGSTLIFFLVTHLVTYPEALKGITLSHHFQSREANDLLTNYLSLQQRLMKISKESSD